MSYSFGIPDLASSSLSLQLEHQQAERERVLVEQEILLKVDKANDSDVEADDEQDVEEYPEVSV